MAEESKGPANPSLARQRMLGMWQKMDAVLGGTETMRLAGKSYMPVHTGEESDRYGDRLSTATLWGMTKLTLEGWVGRPFESPLELDDNVPDQIKALAEDIDQQGTNMDTFARSWFETGISKAFCHVLVDFQGSVEREDGKELSKKDTDAQNMRPYWLLIEPDTVIAARAEVIEGQELLVHLRLHEVTVEVDPDDMFSEVMVERIRVYDRKLDEDGNPSVYVSVYKRSEEKGEANTLKGWPMEVPPFKIDIDVIPLVTFYSNRQGFLLGKSPLDDLCDLNVKHWQSQSDQDAILTIARFPILAASGVDGVEDEDPLEASPNASRDFRKGESATVIGPFKVLTTSDPKGKFYYLEHSGEAIQAGQSSIDKLEEKMSAYGSEFLKDTPDRQTATARSMDSKESTNPLQAVTLSFIDAIQTALSMTAKWMGLDTSDKDTEYKGGTVTLNTEFSGGETSTVDLAALGTARQGRDISRTTYLAELTRRKILAKTFNAEEDKKELQKEALDMSSTQLPAAATNLDPATGQKEKDEKEETKK